jgi:hypothetical protein
MRKLPARRLSILIALLLTSGICARAQDLNKLKRVQELEGLKGASKLSVSVSVEPSTLLASRDINRAVVERLLRRGVRSSASGDRILSVFILAKYDTRLKVYVVSLSVDVGKVVVTTDDELEMVTVWLRRDVMVSDSGWRPLRETLARLVDEFADDYLSMNPVRPGGVGQ